MGLLERIKRFLFKPPDKVIEINIPTADEISVDEVANHPLFRAALIRISQSASQVPLVVYNGSEIASHHIETKFDENTPTPQAIQTIIHDLFLYGNSVWQIRQVGRRVIGLTHIPMVSLTLNEDGSFTVFGLEGSTRLRRDEIVWFKFIDPADPDGWGLSVAKSVARHIKTLIEIDNACAEFLSNGALPLAVFKSSQPDALDAQQRLGVKIQSEHGRGNRFKWLIVWKDVEIERFNSELKLGDLPAIRKTLREEILAILNVPPAVLGFYEYANYANAREQTKIFWRETVIPLLTQISETINAQYLSKVNPSLWCEFDLSAIPYTKEQLDEVSDSLVRLVSAGIITINEAREILGLYEPLEWGDKWWGSLNTVPLAEAEKGDDDA